jgi:elongation factor Ts
MGREDPEGVALGKDVAMQVAAANPVYVSREDVPAGVMEREKAIYREQAQAAGKPEKILGRIAEGKLEKFFGDFCLVEQAFIKDPDRKVRDLLKDAAARTGADVRIAGFARFHVGEGLEKRSDDLAAEVARQLGKS